MKTVHSLVNMELCNEGNKNNSCNSKCNNKNLALNKEELTFEVAILKSSTPTQKLSCDMNFLRVL